MNECLIDCQTSNLHFVLLSSATMHRHTIGSLSLLIIACFASILNPVATAVAASGKTHSKSILCILILIDVLVTSRSKTNQFALGYKYMAVR